jgi:hypothetical protein
MAQPKTLISWKKAPAIRKSKIEAGERVIPLNADAWNTVLLLYRRTQGFGEVRPEHYVIPLKPVVCSPRC